MMEREQQVIWAAGFFDGEGCVTISKPQKRRPTKYELRLFVGQVKIQPLLLLQDLWGGTVCTYNRTTQLHIHQWQTTARQAAKALEEMLPFLQVKAEQARVGLALQSLLGRESRVSDTMVVMREALRQEMAQLNARRPRPTPFTSPQPTTHEKPNGLRLVS